MINDPATARLRCGLVRAKKPAPSLAKSASSRRDARTDEDNLCLRLAANLNEARSSAGMTRSQLASAAGVSRKYILEIEEGTANQCFRSWSGSLRL